MKDIRIDCDLTEQQYRRYMTFHVLGKKKDLLIHFLGSLLVLLFGLANLHVNSPILGTVFIAAAVYLFISRYLRFFLSVRRITKQYGLSETPKHFYTVLFQDASFQIRNQKETARYPWKEICHVYFMEKDRIVYLYMNKNTAFLLPYDGFTGHSPEDLKKVCEEKLPAEKMKIK